MGILRILLVLGLLAACAYLSLRAPWEARLDPTGFRKQLGDAPLWAQPEAPALETFPGFVKGAKLSDELGAKIVVELKGREFFGRGLRHRRRLFFVFGVVGTIIQRRPETSDVAFSLWLSLGLLGGVLVSATIGHMSGKNFPFISECLLVGFIAGLMICVKSQTRLPFGTRKGKPSA